MSIENTRKLTVNDRKVGVYELKQFLKGLDNSDKIIIESHSGQSGFGGNSNYTTLTVNFIPKTKYTGPYSETR